jgi:threonylcarbamoyladenosine tRNA methylthiotransferase MtaB
LGVDVIAGFPSESEAEFSRLCESLMEMPITYLHAFGFSARPGTPAAEMSVKIDEHTIRERVNKLREIGAMKRDEFYKSQLGRIMEVVPQKPRDGETWVTAVSDNYIKLKVKRADIPSGEQMHVKLSYDPSKGYVGMVF